MWVPATKALSACGWRGRLPEMEVRSEYAE